MEDCVILCKYVNMMLYIMYLCMDWLGLNVIMNINKLLYLSLKFC